MFIGNATKRLNVLDFGGALGTTYRQNKKFLDLIRIEKKWAIIDQKKFIEIGKSEFENDSLCFFEKISDINHEIDVTLFGSSLCYLEKPYETLKDIIELNSKYIIINRTPFTSSFDEFISIQHVPKNIYNASYPFWTLSKPKLINYLSPKYKLLEEWSDPLQAYPDESFGLLFRMA